MKTLNFQIEINASKEKIWDVLWDDVSYRKWSTVFCEGSHFVGDLKEGGKIKFVGPDGCGMYSIVEQMIPYELMAFKHLGNYIDNTEQPIDDETNEWSGAMETYTLLESGNTILLKVSVDIVEKHFDYFNESFPKALDLIKELSEG